MNYLTNSQCYLIDRKELNKYSSTQTPLNSLTEFLRYDFKKEEIETLYPEKHIHSEFEIITFLEKESFKKFHGETRVINRLKPLNRKIKNLNQQEKYLLLILNFFRSQKKALIINSLSILHESNLLILTDLLASSLPDSRKSVYLIDTKEQLWKKGFHRFEIKSLIPREIQEIAS